MNIMAFPSFFPHRVPAIFIFAMVLVPGLVISAEPVPPQEENAAGICRDGNATTFAGLDQIFVRDEFRIIYTTKGHHSLPDTRDLNRNGTPDQVEDFATQMITARQIYSEFIGLQHPLNMPRYARVKSIDVFLLNMESGNGLAYDEVINYRLNFDGGDARCTLRIDLRNNLPTQNLTPAHELFHLYQYAYSMFKARWFLEGTARWAEYAMRPGAGSENPLPTTKAAIEDQVFSQTYLASGLWNRLAAITDPSGRLHLSENLIDTTYVDGSPVIHDDILHGPAFMKAVFEALETLSGEVSSRNGWPRYNWEEAEQKSSAHNEEMFHAIIQALQQSIIPGGSQSREINALIEAEI